MHRHDNGRDLPSVRGYGGIGRMGTDTHAHVVGTAYLLGMSTNSTPQPAAPSGKGWCCCLPFIALPVFWLVSAPALPEKVRWFPIWLVAVVWNGTDGRSGISHLLG